MPIKNLKIQECRLKKYILPSEIVPTLNFLLDKNSRIISGDIVLDNREKALLETNDRESCSINKK